MFLAFAILFVCGYVSAQTNQINNTGNVGIGTTAPNTPLEVMGTSTLHGQVAIDSSVVIGDSLVIERDAKVKEDLRVDGKGIFEGKLRTKKSIVADKDAKIKRDIIMEGYADSIQDFGLMFLDNTGRTYPVNKTFFQSITTGLVYQPQPCLQDANGNTVYLAPTWHNTFPNTVYTGIGNCENAAKVGINTNTPDGVLHVRNIANLSDKALVIDRSSGSGQADPLVSVDKNGHLLINAFENTNDALDNKYFLVQDGTTGRKLLLLDNNGLLRAREIKVDDFVWADYVFDEDYILMPLSEVEAFIKEHGHLPNVKSANQLEKEGLNLGDANRMLMEKVEELTLYMIELEKKVKALEAKLNVENK